MEVRENMKECCSPTEDNQKKDLAKAKENCYTPQEKEYKKQTREQEENNHGCGC